MNENILKFQAFKGAKAVTNTKQLKLVGVENTAGGRNALIPSRIAVVLRWKTDGTDIDIYSTDKENRTIWYSGSNKSVPPGILDYDNITGYGPEVVSYRKTDDTVYVDGKFDIDVHFYRGSTPTAYSLDVILNETDSTKVRTRHYESIQSLPTGNSSDNGPAGSGASRFNDVLSISCNTARICSIDSVDSSKLSDTAVILQNAINVSGQGQQETEIFATSYDQCVGEYDNAMDKTGFVDWSCNEETGAKIWH